MDINLLIEKLRNIRDEDVWASMLPVQQLASDAAWELQKVVSNKDLVKENAEIRQKYKTLEYDIKEYQSISDELEKENDDLRDEVLRLKSENSAQEEHLQNGFDLALRYDRMQTRAFFLREKLGDFTFDLFHGYIVDLIKEEIENAKQLQN